MGADRWVGSRGLLLHNWGTNGNSEKNNVYMSAAAGALAGSAGGLLRKIQHILEQIKGN